MSDEPHAERHDDPIGSAAEEAAKLFGALGDWAREHTDRLGSLEDHLATGAPECAYCPICRTVHVIREAGPEVRVHLAGAAASLMQAAAAVLQAAASPGPTRGAGVERIDLDDPDDLDDLDDLDDAAAEAYGENGRDEDPGDWPGTGSREES